MPHSFAKASPPQTLLPVRPVLPLESAALCPPTLAATSAHPTLLARVLRRVLFQCSRGTTAAAGDLAEVERLAAGVERALAERHGRRRREAVAVARAAARTFSVVAHRDWGQASRRARYQDLLEAADVGAARSRRS